MSAPEIPACSTDSARLFDSRLPSEKAAARWLCRSCPVRDACLQDAFGLLNTADPPRSIYAGAEPRDLWLLKSSPAARERHFAKLDAMEEPREPTPEDRRAYHAKKSREFRARRSERVA